ncbi:MAG: hypothetical protein JXB88_13805 [Spirochaetales bacterium]|nr:hypothetical protein [Spirochaetales bacterium]
MAGNAKISSSYQWLENIDDSVLAGLDPSSSANENNVLADFELNLRHQIALSSGGFYVNQYLQYDFNQPETFNHLLKEAYLRYHANDWLSIIIGKQVAEWSLGYFFSPADEITYYNPFLDEETGKPGFLGFGFFIVPFADFSINAYINIDSILHDEENDFWQDIRYGLYSSYLISPLELSGSLIYEEDEVLTTSIMLSLDILSTIITTEFAVDFQNITEFPRETGTPPFYLEWEKNDDVQFSIDIGLEKIIYLDDVTLTIITEYLYTDLGYSKTQADLYYDYLDQLVDFLAALPPEEAQANSDNFDLPRYLSKHYLVQMFGLEVTDLLNTEHVGIFNLTDFSFLVHHTLTYTGIKGMDILGSGTWTYGEQNKTQFGLIPENIIISLGIKVYF